MNTERNEFVNDVTGDIAEVSLDDVNNNPGVDNANTSDVGNLAIHMNYLGIDDPDEDEENAEDMEDELGSENITGAAALPVDDAIMEDPEIFQRTERVTRAVEMSDIEASASNNPEDWGQKWLYEMKMVDKNTAPISMTPTTKVSTINQRLSEEFGPGVIYFGFQYTENGSVIPANPLMSVGELAKMSQINMAFEFNERYKEEDD